MGRLWRGLLEKGTEAPVVIKSVFEHQRMAFVFL